MRMHFEAVARSSDPKQTIVAGLNALKDAGLHDLFTHAIVGGKTFSGSWATIRPKLKPRDGDDVELRSGADDEPDAAVYFLVTSEDSTKIVLELDPELAQADLDRVEKFMSSLYDALSTARWPSAHVTMTGLSYPRPRPPRLDDQWPLGNVVDFVDEKFHTSGDKEARPAQWKLVATAPLPDGASRRKHGKLLILRWLAEVDDVDAAKAAQSQQEQWFSNVLELPRDKQFNELGDQKVTLGFTEPAAPPLTLYRAPSGQGYKAVIPAKNGKLDAAVVKTVESLLGKKKLKDGRPLSSITLIVPTREDALAVREQAKQIGCERAIYADSQSKGVWWDPFPPGEWK